MVCSVTSKFCFFFFYFYKGETWNGQENEEVDCAVALSILEEENQGPETNTGACEFIHFTDCFSPKQNNMKKKKIVLFHTFKKNKNKK